MKCDNERCVFNNEGRCELSKDYISLDFYGMCKNMFLENNKDLNYCV